MNWLGIIIISATTSVSQVVTLPAKDKASCEAAVHNYVRARGAIPAEDMVWVCADTTVPLSYGAAQ